MPSSTNTSSIIAPASEQERSFPKITPFRLAFILTTAGLGIAKAVIASTGKAGSSTTVEWVGGVVVALIFQFLGSCEYNDARPRYLDPFFSHDLFGRAGDGLSEPDANPSVTSAELRERGDSPDRVDLSPQSNATIITGYRLLVSTTCAAFGLAKMLCGYLGSSAAMYTLDWVIAIPLTLGLYSLGLYEDRRSQPLRPLFQVDYSPQTIRVSQIALLIMLELCGLAFSSYWSLHWFKSLRVKLAYSPSTRTAGDDPNLKAESGMWLDVYLRAAQCHDVFVSVVMLSAGVIGVCALLWPVMQFSTGRYRSTIQSAGLRVAAVIFYSFIVIMASSTLLSVFSVLVIIHDVALT